MVEQGLQQESMFQVQTQEGFDANEKIRVMAQMGPVRATKAEAQMLRDQNALLSYECSVLRNRLERAEARIDKLMGIGT